MLLPPATCRAPPCLHCSLLQVQPYCWGDPIGHLANGGKNEPWDYIIACDCVYVQSLVQPLVWSLEQLAATTTTVIVCRYVRSLSRKFDGGRTLLVRFFFYKPSSLVKHLRWHRPASFCHLMQATCLAIASVLHAASNDCVTADCSRLAGRTQWQTGSR